MENCMDLPDKRSCNSSHLPDFNTDIKVNIMCSATGEFHTFSFRNKFFESHRPWHTVKTVSADR